MHSGRRPAAPSSAPPWRAFDLFFEAVPRAERLQQQVRTLRAERGRAEELLVPARSEGPVSADLDAAVLCRSNMPLRL